MKGTLLSDPKGEELSPSEAERHDSSPAVSIVVLTWNNYTDTARCLESLEAAEYPNFDVYVADNCSTDGSIERLQKEFSWCQFVLNESNLGFAAGVNRAIEQALDGDADYVLTLNNDTVVEPDFLGPLVETAESSPDIAVVGGVIFDPDGEIWSAGGKFCPTLAKLSHNRDPDREIYETRFVSGAMMLLPREFLESVGGFNEDYFFGMEDEELAWEARRRGKKLVIDTRSKIRHDAGSSAPENGPFRYYHDLRNRIHFVFRNLPHYRVLIFLLFMLTTRMIRFAQWAARGRSDLIHITLLAVRDHALGAPLRKPEDFD